MTTTHASVESVPFPEPLSPAEAHPGLVVTLYLDDMGKLYRIEDVTDRGSVHMVRQDGRKFRARPTDLQKTDRPFPALPEFLPRPGMFVVTAGVRGWKADEPVIVTKLVSAKATVMRLDGTGRYANVPFTALRQVDVEVTVK